MSKNLLNVTDREQLRSADFPKMSSFTLEIPPFKIPVKVITQAYAVKSIENGGLGEPAEWVNRTNGWWDVDKGTIYVMAHLHPLLQRKVVLHELVHAANDLGWCFELNTRA